MRIIAAIGVTILGSLLGGCMMPQIIRPLDLYNLSDGSKMEVRLHPTSPNHGIITSPGNQPKQFSGEYVLYDQYYGPPSHYPPLSKNQTALLSDSVVQNFAEAYGFGKNADARPMGSGVIVGTDGTIFQLVFFYVSPDHQTGDGVAMDNKKQFYRLFFSTSEL